MLILPNGLRSTTDETYFKHAKQHGWLQDHQLRYYQDHPLCERCERIALRDKGWNETQAYQCPYCGHRGSAMGKPRMREYVEEKLYK